MTEEERRRYTTQQLKEEEARLLGRKFEEEPVLKTEDFYEISKYWPYLKVLFVFGGSFILVSAIANMIWR